LSAVQHPSLREVALGGRDTASRAQVAWQVRLMTKDAVATVQKRFDKLAGIRKTHPGPYHYRKGNLDDFRKFLADTTILLLPEFDAAAPSANFCSNARIFFDCVDEIGPLMRARARYESRNLDPCAIPADAQFRSRDNQHYRVEIHHGGIAGVATWKWSRENGSVEFAVHAVNVDQSGIIMVTIDTLGHDRRTGLCEGDWVELTSDAFEYGEVAPPLGQVTAINRATRMVTIKFVKIGGIDFTGCTLLRRWDQSLESDPDLAEDGTIPVQESSEGGWTVLERGVQVQFVPGGFYRTGDYWLIPARVETNDIVWPQSAGSPTAIPPHGVERHRAVLGFGLKGANDVTFTSCACVITPQCDR
jgi:hypothetical protein